MGRHRGSILDDLIRLPWWVSVVCSAGALVMLRFIRIEAEDAGRKPGDESLPSRRLGWRSQIGFLIC